VWRVTLRGLLAHRVRLLLTTLSVVLGVAFVSGTYVLTDSMSAVFEDLVRGGTGTVDVLVRAERPGGGNAVEDLDVALLPLPAGLVDEVLAVEGVSDAEGSVEGFAMIVRPDGEAITPMGPPTVGASWSASTDRVIQDGGQAPAGPYEVVIDSTTAQRNDLVVGDRVSIVFSNTPPREFTVVGISTVEDGDNLAGATLAQFDPLTAQQLLGLEQQFTAISVRADVGTDPQVLAERIDVVLPDGAEAITGEAWADETMGDIEQALGFITALFGVFAAVALVVGAFIIANTLSITVLQRTREFALLRALGASRRQIVGSVIGEAVVVGLLASVLGIVAGLGLAIGLNALLRGFGLDMPSGPPVLAPRTVAVAVAVGLGVTVASSLLPARRAGGIHPITAMRSVALQAFRPSRRRVAGGVVAAVAASALVLVAAVWQPGGAGAMVGAAAVLALVALAATGPLLTGPVVRLFGGSGARLGAVGRLARSNTLRTPRRTWTTAAALTIGLALVSSVAVIAASMKSSVSAAMDETMRADVIVTASTSMTGGTVPPVLAPQLRALPEVDAVSPLRAGTGEVDGRASTVLAVDPSAWDAVSVTDFAEGSVTDIAPVWSVAVDAEVAQELGYQVGDVVPATFRLTGPTELTIAAIFEPDQVLSGWLVSTATYGRLFHQPSDAAVLVSAGDGVAPEAALAAVEAVAAAYPAVAVQDQAQYRDTVAGQVDQLLALVTALLGMALFIAVLGIMNTLALSIHERTHEIGLLRAVGMTRRQVRGMIRWEAVTVALLGAVVGLVLGVVFGWATTRALADEGMSVFVLPGGQLGLGVVLAAVAGVLAAIVPARRAARLDVLRAVTVE
jgi:putative ABC transport system permease protein